MSQEQLFIKAIMTAMGAHGTWKLRLRTAVATGSSNITPAQARCDKSCEFGKWLHGQAIDPQTKSGTPYKVVTRLHREFHESAAQVIEQAVTGEADRARALMDGEFNARSEQLTRALTKWRGEIASNSKAA